MRREGKNKKNCFIFDALDGLKHFDNYQSNPITTAAPGDKFFGKRKRDRGEKNTLSKQSFKRGDFLSDFLARTNLCAKQDDEVRD